MAEGRSPVSTIAFWLTWIGLMLMPSQGRIRTTRKQPRFTPKKANNPRRDGEETKARKFHAPVRLPSPSLPPSATAITIPPRVDHSSQLRCVLSQRGLGSSSSQVQPPICSIMILVRIWPITFIVTPPILSAIAFAFFHRSESREASRNS